MSELELLRVIADQAIKIKKLEEDVKYSANLEAKTQSKLEKTLKELWDTNAELNEYKIEISKLKEANEHT